MGFEEDQFYSVLFFFVSAEAMGQLRPPEGHYYQFSKLYMFAISSVMNSNKPHFTQTSRVNSMEKL